MQLIYGFLQVAEMHAELMEFNQHLQRRLREMESLATIEVLDYTESNVKLCIPSAFLVGKKTHSYHVYQVKLYGLLFLINKKF